MDIRRVQNILGYSFMAIFAVFIGLYPLRLIGEFGMKFYDAYKIKAWLCWVPNILIAEFLIVRKLPRLA
ncbi:MAG: DUF2306 domain-containing protein [Bacteroidia bacterium]|nr:DUF2306 domain-containing protein [Bacteroidia bacterium]